MLLLFEFVQLITNFINCVRRYLRSWTHTADIIFIFWSFYFNLFLIVLNDVLNRLHILLLLLDIALYLFSFFIQVETFDKNYGKIDQYQLPKIRKVFQCVNYFDSLRHRIFILNYCLFIPNLKICAFPVFNDIVKRIRNGQTWEHQLAPPIPCSEVSCILFIHQHKF
jgi:hypothetical protein